MRYLKLFIQMVLGLLVAAQFCGAGEPNYVKGEKLKDSGRSHWALGSTGIIANVWGSSGNQQTRKTRTFQVREVLKGSPADGKVEVGDVILGVAWKTFDQQKDTYPRFTADAGVAMANAITQAETGISDGKLVLNLWRKGKVSPAILNLEVLGAYSETSPWDCKKATAIIDEHAAFLMKRGFTWKNAVDRVMPLDGIDNVIDGLGLLAIGEEKYLPPVQWLARRLAGRAAGQGGDADKNPSTWETAYKLIFMAEYYLATGDKEVLPGLKRSGIRVAQGRSGVGTWGHSLRNPNDGLYGPPTGYGAMNQCSITCAIALALVQKCGIEEKVIDDAVYASTQFYRYYVDKGCVPYGDHAPADRIDNNGRNSQVAVLFDLVGDGEAAAYFTRMALASYNLREAGHGGNYFSWLWGALGAARGGEAAAQSFIRNTRWFTELERRHDGSAFYQYMLGGYGGKHGGWSTVGSRLLQHCLPRRKLYITGRGGSSVEPIVGKELEEVVAVGRMYLRNKPAKELLVALGNWCPAIRAEAAEELGKRDDNVATELTAMLDSPNRYARYGACLGSRHAGRESVQAVDKMIDKMVHDDDLTMRYFAVKGMALRASLSRKEKNQGKTKHLPNGLGDTVRRSAPALLKLAAQHDPERDYYRKLQMSIAETLFGPTHGETQGHYAGGRYVDRIDRKLLIPALKSLLQHPNGGVRSHTASVFPVLSKADLELLWGDVYQVVKNPAPSGVMFGGRARIEGVAVMAKHHVKEGLPLGIYHVTEERGWGAGKRREEGVEALAPYGPALGDAFPTLEKFASKASKSPVRKKLQAKLAEAKKAEPPKLISIAEHLGSN